MHMKFFLIQFMISHISGFTIIFKQNQSKVMLHNQRQPAYQHTNIHCDFNHSRCRMRVWLRVRRPQWPGNTREDLCTFPATRKEKPGQMTTRKFFSFFFCYSIYHFYAKIQQHGFLLFDMPFLAPHSRFQAMYSSDVIMRGLFSNQASE